MSKGLMITNIVLTSAVLVTVLFIFLDDVMIPPDITSTSSLPPDTNWMEDSGGMYEASATILALVSLGAVLGVRFGASVKGVRYQGEGIILVFVFTTVVIVAQTFTMLGLCCIGITQWTYGVLLVITAVALILVILGYARITSVPYREALRENVWKERQAKLDTSEV